MEFRLNKVDTDLRDRLQEEIKSDKIHGNNSTSIKKDIKEDDSKNNANKEKKYLKSKKKFFTIDGVKSENQALDIRVEKLENIDETNSKGRVLDIEK